MLIKSDTLAEFLRQDPNKEEDPLVIQPMPNLDVLQKEANGSVDLRLGRWFITLRHTRHSNLDVAHGSGGVEINESSIARRYFVRFGDRFWLHPRTFVLGATIEWIRMPSNMVGFITGKSSWGRRGLIIETAPGIHPGFSGCLTLEMTNVGEIPIAILPGMTICQVFFHQTTTSPTLNASRLSGFRRPTLGKLELDDIAKKLMSDLT